jgi:hypothetical protein
LSQQAWRGIWNTCSPSLPQEQMPLVRAPPSGGHLPSKQYRRALSWSKAERPYYALAFLGFVD